MDMNKLRTYTVAIILIVVIILFRDMFIGLINVFLSLAGAKTIGDIPPGFLFMIFAVLLFGFALVVMMILQKKKQARLKTSDNPDITPIGLCDICCDTKAKNIKPMDYKEGDKTSIVYVCEKCRNDIEAIKE